MSFTEDIHVRKSYKVLFAHCDPYLNDRIYTSLTFFYLHSQCLEARVFTTCIIVLNASVTVLLSDRLISPAHARHVTAA